MKQLFSITLFFFYATLGYGQANLFVEEKGKDVKVKETDQISITPKNYYKHRDDGTPGRAVVFSFSKKLKIKKGKIEVQAGTITESYKLASNEIIQDFEILLPEGIAVDENIEAKVKISAPKISFSGAFKVPALRHWEVFIYPHSHVDIGYTNTHANVELIHTRNVLNGLELAKKTKNYPEGAKYKWNPEVIWPVERYLTSHPEEKQKIINGIKEGYLPLDAGYVNVNTSLASEEELFEFFRQGQQYKKETGQPIETLVQVDIPGMTWGMIPVAAKLGIKYIFSFNNGYDRVGWSTDHNFKPFWWTDKEGKNKLLYLQPGSYNPGALIKGKYYWPKMAGQTNPDKLIEIVKTDNPRENFIDAYLNKKLPELENADYYPYNIFPMSWAMADNTPIDADLPEAVKSWNEDYAYPKLKIVSATEIMREFDKRYGDQIPTYKGDFTEFWTDGGAGTAAKQTAQNRASKERLVQAETLWTMLKTGEPAPRQKFNEAWWNILMGSEHTWCYMAPHQEPINSVILSSKFAFFNNAEQQSKALLKMAIPETNSEYIAVFNNLSWERTGIVTLTSEMSKGFSSVTNVDGKPVKAQKLSSGELIFKAENVPAFGSKKYKLSKMQSKQESSFVQNNVLDNGIVRVEISRQTGDVTSLKLGDTEFVDNNSNCAVNSFRYLEADDSPEKASSVKNVKISIEEDGPLKATLQVESEAKGCNKLTSEISVYAGLPTVDFKNNVDKIATVKKEGVHFGFAFDVENPRMVADIPWGMMEVEKDQLPGSNRNWIALQRWLTISNDIKGITWCPIEAPLFQVGNITANILGAATHSDQWIRKLEPSATIYSWALNNHWHTNFQLSQGGSIVLRYKVQPYLQNVDYTQANRFGIEQHQPLVATTVDKDYQTGQLLKIEGSSAVLSTVFKSSEDGKFALLRLRSISDKDEKVRLQFLDRKPTSIHLFDIKLEASSEEITEQLTVPAQDFVTLKINW
jgi:hypothetical protein